MNPAQGRVLEEESRGSEVEVEASVNILLLLAILALGVVTLSKVLSIAGKGEKLLS